MSKKQSPIESTQVYPPVILTLWQDAWSAITQPSKAIRWALQPFRRTIGYLFLLSIVLAIVSTAYFFIRLKPAIESFRDWSVENVPAISFADGTLSIEDDETFGFTDSDQFYFKVDPTQSVDDEPMIDSFYEAGILITSDQIIIQEKDNRDRTEIINLNELEVGNFTFDGNSIASFINDVLMPLSYVVVPLIVFVYIFFAKLLYSLFFSVLLFFFTGLKYNLVHLWAIAISALTPAILAGYLSFIFAPIFGLYTFVFIAYLIFGFGHYVRYTTMKPKQ